MYIKPMYDNSRENGTCYAQIFHMLLLNVHAEKVLRWLRCINFIPFDQMCQGMLPETIEGCGNIRTVLSFLLQYKNITVGLYLFL